MAIGFGKELVTRRRAEEIKLANEERRRKIREEAALRVERARLAAIRQRRKLKCWTYGKRIARWHALNLARTGRKGMLTPQQQLAASTAALTCR